MSGKKAYLDLLDWAILEPRPAPLRPVLLPKPLWIPERPPWPWIEVEYPSADGEPMAANDWQWDAVYDAGRPLKMQFAALGDVDVGSDLLVYWGAGVLDVRSGGPPARPALARLWPDRA